FANEVHVVDGLRHPHIVRLVGFVEDMKNRIAWLVFPWEANGNVREFLLNGEWEIPERVSLIRDVASGLDYLHTRKPPICHGDLKSLNILVNSTHRAIITDFGSARALKEAHSNAELTLTGPSWSFRWAAPEILNDEQPGLASDIWALGWIAWEIMTDNYPFPESKNRGLITIKVIQGQLPEIYDNCRFSQIRELCHVMTRCWRLDPNQRPSSNECCCRLSLIVSRVFISAD
ncbi:hypothetical protein M407DRAFT_66796, partial [Tulasnella calospora MUT 4182]